MAKNLHRNSFSCLVHGFSLLCPSACLQDAGARCLAVCPHLPHRCPAGLGAGPCPAAPCRRPRARLWGPELLLGFVWGAVWGDWLQGSPMGMGTKGLLLVPAIPRQNRGIRDLLLALGSGICHHCTIFEVPAFPR